MPVVPITRLRVRSRSFLPAFFVQTLRIARQAKRVQPRGQTAAGSPEHVLDRHELVVRGLDEGLHACGTPRADYA